MGNYPAIIRISAVEDLTKLHRSTIYNLMRKGEFPMSVQLGCAAVGWLEDEVTEWMNQRIEQRTERVKTLNYTPYQASTQTAPILEE